MYKMNTYETTIALQMMPAKTFQEEILLVSDDRSKTRLEIEAAVCNKLDGSALKDALFIIDNIRENRMKIKWASGNTWSVRFNRKHVCELKIENGSLKIGPVSDVLVTRTKSMSHNQETIEQLIDALRDSITGTKETFVFSH